MRYALILTLGVAVGLGRVAIADEPGGPGAPSPQALGAVEAILDKCAAIDPPNAERYHSQAQMLTQGVSPDDVAKTRKTDAYKQAYDASMESLRAIVVADAVKTCRGSLGTGK